MTIFERALQFVTSGGGRYGPVPDGGGHRARGEW